MYSGYVQTKKPLQTHQEGDQATVGEPVVAEVEVPRELAAEDGALLAHGGLDEGVADPGAHRRTAGALDGGLREQREPRRARRS